MIALLYILSFLAGAAFFWLCMYLRTQKIKKGGTAKSFAETFESILNY